MLKAESLKLLGTGYKKAASSIQLRRLFYRVMIGSIVECDLVKHPRNFVIKVVTKLLLRLFYHLL